MHVNDLIPSNFYSELKYLGRPAPNIEDISFIKNGTEIFELSKRICSRWQKIGLVLGIEHDKMRYLAADKSRETEEKYKKILDIWLDEASSLPNSDDYPLSWQGLKTLLEDIDESAVAKQLFAFLDAIPQDQ